MSTDTIDTKALDSAADTFSRSMRALNSMELADLPPELDQDARDIARIILDHGKGYEGTEHGDMTAPLLESLARLVQAAKAADRLAALEAELASAREAERVQRERAELARVRALIGVWRRMHKAAVQVNDGHETAHHAVLKTCADQLDAELDAKAAEQHDPLAVSDHCGECGEPEPECACDERESLPLMARREWMGDGTDYFVVHGDFCLEIKALNGRAPYYDEGGELLVCAEAGDSIERDQVDAEAQLDGIYRIADTDEHGLPVIERTADIPEDVTHMTLHTRRFFRAGELRARSVEGDEGLLRIEDYRPAAQESGDA